MATQHFLGAVLLVLTAACSVSDRAGSETKGQRTPDMHTSRLALDWSGTYSGMLPCASCEGIETVITLRTDETFDRSLTYRGDSPVPVNSSGKFHWSSSGNTMSIELADDETQQYQVGEHRLFHLDGNGGRITGDLASHYVLEKHLSDPAIEDQRWLLVELQGYTADSLRLAKEADLTLNSDDSMVSGSTSCNRYSGGYAIKRGKLIEFSRRMATTRMLCPEMSVEAGFMDALEAVTRYSLSERAELILQDTNGLLLARFTASEGAR